MEPIRRDRFAEDFRIANPDLKYWDDQKVFDFFTKNYPELAEQIEWQDPPSAPSQWERSTAPWIRQAHKAPQMWEAATTSFKNSLRADPEVGKELQGWLKKNATFGTRGVDWEAAEEKYKEQNAIDIENYLQAKKIADEKIKNSPTVQGVEAWYAENPPNYNPFLSPENILHGFNEMASSYLPIVSSAVIGSGFGLFAPTGVAAALGTAYTMEAGNNFETAFETLIKEDVPREKAFEIAKKSAHLYGTMSAVLESLAPAMLIKPGGWARSKLTERTSRIFQKDILKDTWKQTGKSFNKTQLGKKMTDGARDYAYKYGNIKQKFSTDNRVTNAVKNVLGKALRVSGKVIKPTKTKMTQGFTEAWTEGLQYLTEEAIQDGFVLPQTGNPGEWDWDSIVDEGWLTKKLNSQGFYESVALGAYTYFLPFGGGAKTKPSKNKYGTFKVDLDEPTGSAVSSGRVKVISKDKISEPADDTTDLKPGVQKWRDFTDPSKVDLTSQVAPKEQMLAHAINSPGALKALESNDLTEDEQFNIVQQLGEAINSSNLPSEYNIQLNSENGVYNRDDVIGLLKKAVISKSKVTTKKVPTGGMGTGEVQEINLSKLGKKDLVKLQQSPGMYNNINLPDFEYTPESPTGVTPDVGEQDSELVDTADEITRTYASKGKEVAKEKVIGLSAKKFKELAKGYMRTGQKGITSSKGDELFDLNKDGSISSTKKNKQMIFNLIESVIKADEIAAQGANWGDEADQADDRDQTISEPPADAPSEDAANLRVGDVFDFGEEDQEELSWLEGLDEIEKEHMEFIAGYLKGFTDQTVTEMTKDQRELSPDWTQEKSEWLVKKYKEEYEDYIADPIAYLEQSIKDSERGLKKEIYGELENTLHVQKQLAIEKSVLKKLKKGKKPEPSVKVTPENITKLEPNQVFVFGSNYKGIHGKGAALTAKKKFGAKQGVGEGLQGQSYAIPTKDSKLTTFSLSVIGEHINKFIDFALDNPTKEFIVTKIGTGLANISVADMAELWKSKIIPANIILPDEFLSKDLRNIRQNRLNSDTTLDDDTSPSFYSSTKSEKLEINQPRISESPELADKLAKRMNKMFGKKLGITGEQVTQLYNDHGEKVAGMALGRAATWSSTARIDVIPHEYFHPWFKIFGKHPLLKKAFNSVYTDKRFRNAFEREYGYDVDERESAEELLTLLIGDYVAERIQDKGLKSKIKIFIRKLWLGLKGLFKNLTKEEYVAVVGEKFFKGWTPWLYESAIPGDKSQKITSVMKEFFNLPRDIQVNKIAKVSDNTVISYIVSAPVKVIEDILDIMPIDRAEKLRLSIVDYRNILKKNLESAEQLEYELAHKNIIYMPSGDARYKFFKELNQVVPSYSQLDEQMSLFDAQTNEDGQQEEIAPVDNLKDSSSDIFLRGQFITAMGTYIPNKFMAVDVFDAAKGATNFNEFDEWFQEEIKKQFDGAVREGSEEIYDKYARQLYNAKRSTTKLYAYKQNEANKDGSHDTEIIDENGRIKWEMVFEIERGKAVGKNMGTISRNNHARRGTQNPQSFRQNFIEQEYELGNTDARFIELPEKMLFNHVKPITEGKNPFYSQQWVKFELTPKWIDNFDADLANMSKPGSPIKFFFSTKSGDKPSIYFSATPSAWTGSAQESLKGKTVNVADISRDFFIAELEAQGKMGWLIDNKTDGGHAQNMLADADKLSTVKSKKVKTGEDAKGKPIYKYQKQAQNPYAYAQILGKHIRWQQLKGNRYLMRELSVPGNAVRQMIRRLPLDFSEGLTFDGLSDRRIMWADWKEIEVEMPDENGNMQRVDLDGVKGYKWDGSLFTGSRYLTEMGKTIGRNSLPAIKTVVRYLSPDQNDYYLSKHMEFAAWKGMKIYKKGEDNPIARVVGSGQDTYFMELDAAGNDVREFDSFETTEELKDKDGVYATPFKVHTLPSRSTKGLIIPSQSDTSPHPVNFHDLVLDEILMATPEGQNYQLALDKFIKKNVSDYVDKLVEFREDPAELSEYLQRELPEGQMPTEIDEIVRMFPMGEGLSIPQYKNQVVMMLNNRFLKNGAFKLRTSRGNGSKLYTKGHEVRVDDGKFALPSDNRAMVNLVINEYLKSSLSGNATKRSQVGWEGEHDMIKDLNAFLIKRPKSFLLHRQPIQGANKVEPRFLQQFVEGEHGDVIFLSNEDLMLLHDADNDGDTIYVERQSPELIDALGQLATTQEWADRNRIVDTSIFKRPTVKTTLSKREDTGKFYKSASTAMGGQGMVVSVKNVSSVMGYKNLNFSLSFLPDGDRIHARKNSDVVVMNFIKLNDNMTKQQYDMIKENGDKVVMFRMNKDSKKKEWSEVPWEFTNDKGKTVNGLKTAAKGGYSLHLETTHENQMSNLLMMAVDNPKEGLLNEFGFDWNFLMKKAFYLTRNGAEVPGGFPAGVPRFLTAAYRVFNRGKTRSGRSMNNNAMGMGAIQAESERIRAIYWEEDGKTFRKENKINGSIMSHMNDGAKGKRGKPIMLYVKGKGRMQAFVNDLKIDPTKVSPMEKLISQIDKSLGRKKHVEALQNMGKDILTRPGWHYEYAHVESVHDLDTQMENERVNILKKADKSEAASIGEAVEFTEKMTAEQNKIFKEAADKIRLWSTEADIRSIKYEYQPEFQEFIEKWLPKWNQLSELQQSWSTLHFLAGTHHINKKGAPTKVAFRGVLLPLQLMSEKVIKQYGKLFHEKLKSKNMVKKTTGEAQYNFGFPDFLDLHRKSCG